MPQPDSSRGFLPVPESRDSIFRGRRRILAGRLPVHNVRGATAGQKPGYGSHEYFWRRGRTVWRGRASGLSGSARRGLPATFLADSCSERGKLQRRAELLI